ncbi:hypothetical protein ACFGVR_04755 [Mucilaginibacter sp. AW1-3]
MEERKTAAYVLSVVALIFLYIFWLRPYRDLKKEHTLSFKTCSVKFHYRYAVDTNETSYGIAKTELVMCVCSLYMHKPDTAAARFIMNYYKKHGQNPSPDSLHHAQYNNLDSIIKYREKALDPRYMWDD